MAGRGTDIRIPAKVAELGGLAVIATERHESGRIDRQLFGRSGRQGDPSTAQAFISWEDEVLLRFRPPWVRRGARRLSGETAVRAQRRAIRLAQLNAQRHKHFNNARWCSSPTNGSKSPSDLPALP